MKVFVSGATGSIGAHLVKMLSERGHTVHALVRSMEKARKLAFENVFPFQGDITDKDSVDKAMKGCDQAYHTAALAAVWARDTKIFYDINVRGTINVLQSAVDHKIKRVVFTSTAGIFGPSINGIITEEKVRDVDIFNEYEGSKLMAESAAKDFVNLHGLDVVIVSPTRVYGPFLFGEPSSTTLVIDKYVNHGWKLYPGDGHGVGNYVYIEDVALGHILAMEKGRKGETYLIGGKNYSYIEFFYMLGAAAGINRKMIKIPMWMQMFYARIQLFMAVWFGKPPELTPKWIIRGKYHYELSPQKAIDELGLPVTPFEEGLKKSVEWVRSK
ncbi:SDR family oxidoreductase [Bacteroidota bacterium]